MVLLYPIFPAVWAGTTLQLISTSPDSTDIAELPTTSSPLHPVSRKGAGEAREKREARFEIRNSKFESRNKHQGPNSKKLKTPSPNAAASTARASNAEVRAGDPCVPKASRGRCAARKKQGQGQDAPATQGRDALATRATAFRSFGLCALDLSRIDAPALAGSSFEFRISAPRVRFQTGGVRMSSKQAGARSLRIASILVQALRISHWALGERRSLKM